MQHGFARAAHTPGGDGAASDAVYTSPCGTWYRQSYNRCAPPSSLGEVHATISVRLPHQSTLPIVALRAALGLFVFFLYIIFVFAFLVL